jgi:hypothetical protein
MQSHEQLIVSILFFQVRLVWSQNSYRKFALAMVLNGSRQGHPSRIRRSENRLAVRKTGAFFKSPGVYAGSPPGKAAPSSSMVGPSSSTTSHSSSVVGPSSSTVSPSSSMVGPSSSVAALLSSKAAPPTIAPPSSKAGPPTIAPPSSKAAPPEFAPPSSKAAPLVSMVAPLQGKAAPPVPSASSGVGPSTSLASSGVVSLHALHALPRLLDVKIDSGKQMARVLFDNSMVASATAALLQSRISGGVMPPIGELDVIAVEVPLSEPCVMYIHWSTITSIVDPTSFVEFFEELFLDVLNAQFP